MDIVLKVGCAIQLVSLLYMKFIQYLYKPDNIYCFLLHGHIQFATGANYSSLEAVVRLWV